MSKAVSSIASHTSIKGELRFAGPAVVGGQVQGMIESTDALEIGAEGVIDGNIHGVEVTIHGTVKGNVVATLACRLGPTARVAGDLCAATLEIAKGARFIGHVCVGEDMAAAGAAVPGDVQAAADRAEEAAATRVVEATINRVERVVNRMEPAGAALTMLSVPTMPEVQVLAEAVQTLQRAPRIIKAR